MPETTPLTLPLTSQGNQHIAVSHFNATEPEHLVIIGLRYATPTPPGGRRGAAESVLLTGRPASSAEETEITVRGDAGIVSALRLGGLRGQAAIDALVGPYQLTNAELEEAYKLHVQEQGFSDSDYDCFVAGMIQVGIAARQADHNLHELQHAVDNATTGEARTTAINNLRIEHDRQYDEPTMPTNEDGDIKSLRSFIRELDGLCGSVIEFFVTTHARTSTQKKAATRHEFISQAQAEHAPATERAKGDFAAILRRITTANVKILHLLIYTANPVDTPEPAPEGE